jgi:hypothetical protein
MTKVLRLPFPATRTEAVPHRSTLMLGNKDAL